MLEDESGGLMVSELPHVKVDIYVKPLVEIKLDQQEQATLLVSTMAAGQVAGFLAPETSAVGAAAAGTLAGMAEAVSGPAVQAPAVGELESGLDDEADNEDEAPVTPKRAPTAGSSGQSPAVVKMASKSTTPSKRRLEKVVPHTVEPNWLPMPPPRVTRQEFLWLGQALDYPISALQPAQYIEAAREKVEGMAEVMRKDMWAAAAEMEGLRLHKKIMVRSVDIILILDTLIENEMSGKYCKVE
ncbi:hypothetical protein C0992_007226 [Termitomyces sp. T32_za158]|nr:hypothetical protein C0992_007226 [Termitomyces sp. T32_za158]